eukprot:scaffold412764_cov28-Attheya_sp.AAC.1
MAIGCSRNLIRKDWAGLVCCTCREKLDQIYLDDDEEEDEITELEQVSQSLDDPVALDDDH